MEVTEHQICEALLQHIHNNILDQSVEMNVETPFKEISLDSLSLIDLILFLERRFNISVPDTELQPENLLSVKTLAGCAFRYI